MNSKICIYYQLHLIKIITIVLPSVFFSKLSTKIIFSIGSSFISEISLIGVSMIESTDSTKPENPESLKI